MDSTSHHGVIGQSTTKFSNRVDVHTQAKLCCCGKFYFVHESLCSIDSFVLHVYGVLITDDPYHMGKCISG